MVEMIKKGFVVNVVDFRGEVVIVCSSGKIVDICRLSCVDKVCVCFILIFNDIVEKGDWFFYV